MRASSRRAAFGRGLEALLLLAVVTLTTGCPLIIPVPGKVDAGHSGSATAALQHDDGLVIVVARDTGNRELEEHVISCAREAMEKMPLAPRIVAADTSLRNAFHSLQEGERATGARGRSVLPRAHHHTESSLCASRVDGTG